jgi:nicotinamidase-related amidase
MSALTPAAAQEQTFQTAAQGQQRTIGLRERGGDGIRFAEPPPLNRKQPVDAIIVVDMQVGLLNGPPKHDLQGVIQRINSLTAMVREHSGKVIWVRHCGKTGDGFERDTEGWSFLPELSRHRDDAVIEKTLNDSFVRTSLQETLKRIAPDRLLVTGWATDSCVDSTIRSAISNDYHVVVVSDGHTVSDRPHLDAAAVIRHHHWVWSHLFTNRSVRIMTTGQLLDEGAA